MKPERWHEVERLYHAARDREGEERRSFLDQACGGNASLREEVESLLACRSEAEEFMRLPVPDLADRVLAESRTAVDAGPRHGRRRVLPPWWIILLSIPFATSAAFLYFWLFWGPEPVGWMLQVDNRASSEGWNRINTIFPQSPAERAGFERGDLIRTADLDQFRSHPLSADQFRFEVKRRGENVELNIIRKQRGRTRWLCSEGVRALTLTIDSVLYLVLAAILVVLQPADSLARWGAMMLAQLGIQMLLMATRNPGSSFFLESAQALRAFPFVLGPAVLVGMSISIMVPAGAFGFLGGFPRTPLTGKRAWLLAWVPGILATIPIDLRQFWLPVYEGASGRGLPVWLLIPGWILGVGYLVASVVLLVHNNRSIGDRNERRRLRLLAAGFGIGVLSFSIGVAMGMPWAPIERFRYAYYQGSYFDSARPLLLGLAPICTAYAILRHRIFDIHVMVRLGLRYAAARGLLLSIIPAAGIVLAADLLTHGNEPLLEIARRRGLLYAAIALGAFLLHAWQKTWLNALDLRFFREHYDARRLLGAVVEDVRQADTFEEAARHVISQIEGSLHPEFAGLLLRKPGGASFGVVASTPGSPPPIPAQSRLIDLMRLTHKPLENSQSQPGRLHRQLPPEDVEYLHKTRTEWLLPVTLGIAGPESVLLLGPKRSEEPYSQEDREILSAITGSLALLLERSPMPAPGQVGFGECPECGGCYDPGIGVCEKDGAGLSISCYSRALARRYRFERRLGRGGMGTVYEAQDTELERRVAVKVIRPELMPGTDAVARFRWEAKAAAGFAHPNVVTVYDFGVAEDNRAYLVMELLSGSNLREEMVRCGRLDANRVFGILGGVSAAIEAAHERKLLHRDLKPENIFLARSGSEEVAKVLDFGLAKLMAGQTGVESVPGTAPGMLIGTLPYMSPERIRGGNPMESWDIWALTVMAFEMLTGVHPFSALTTWGSLLAEDGFPPIEEDAPALTGELKQFFKRSLAIDRSQRPPSARQFMRELAASL